MAAVSSLVFSVFHLPDKLLQLVHGDVLLAHQRRHGIEKRIVKILADDTFQRTRAEVLPAHRSIILIGVAVSFVRQVSFFFQPPYNGREGIEMRFRVVVERKEFFHKQRPLFPKQVHYFLFLGSEFFHKALV